MLKAKNRSKSMSYDSVLTLLSLIPIFLIIVLGFISWEWADDYSIKFLSVKFDSTIEYMFDRYMQWDGRSLTLPALIQVLLIKYTNASIAGIIWASCFMVTSYFILQIILHETNLESSYRIILWSVISLLLWHGMHSHISETVYWMTGGIYICYAMIAVVWCYLLITRKIFKLNSIIITFISFIAGSTSHNLVTGLFVLLSWYFVLDISDSKKTYLYTLRNYFSLFLGLALGAVLIIAAPGNYIRASYNSNSFDSSLMYLTSYFSNTSIYYVKNTMLLIALSPIISVVLYRYSNLKRGTNKEKIYKVLFYNSKWFFAALSTVIPMIFVPGFVSPRTGIFFQVFIAVFSISFFINFIDLLIIGSNELDKIMIMNEGLFFDSIYYVRKTLTNLINNKNSYLVGFVVGLMMIVNVMCVFSECNKAFKIKKEIDNRVIFLSKYNGKNTNIILSKIDSPVPNSKKFDDISVDIKDWKNVAVAQFFGVKSVRLGLQNNISSPVVYEVVNN